MFQNNVISRCQGVFLSPFSSAKKSCGNEIGFLVIDDHSNKMPTRFEVILINVKFSPKIVLLSYFFDFLLNITCYCTLRIYFSSQNCYLENGFERVSACFFIEVII